MMFASASGVLKQRASPNARCSPNVMPNTPPLPGTSSMHVRVGVGDVLAEHADAFVARHLLVQREPDRLAERDRLARRRRGSDRRASSVTGGGPTTWSSTRRRRGPRRRERGVGRGAHRLAAPRRASARPARRERAARRRARCSSTSIGSCAASSASSSAPRYFFWSSESECEYGRVTSAWMRHGPGAGAHVRDRVGALAAHLEVVAAVHLHDVQAADAAHHLRDRRGRLIGRAAPRSRSRCRRRRRAPGGAGGTRC